MEADESKNCEPDPSTGYWPRLNAVLAAGCCVLPVAIMFVSGIVAGWVASLGISDAAWSWIAQGAVVAVAAVVFLRQLWNRRSTRRRQRSVARARLAAR